MVTAIQVLGVVALIVGAVMLATRRSWDKSERRVLDLPDTTPPEVRVGPASGAKVIGRIGGAR